jgi:glutathione S-transferase
VGEEIEVLTAYGPFRKHRGRTGRGPVTRPQVASARGRTAMLTFYTNPMSRGRIARWMLEETGQPYETVVLDYHAAMKAPEYLALNPMGKVPALVHDGTVVTEARRSAPIWRMAFPEKGLMAEDRPAFFRWMFFAAGPLEQAVVNTSFGWKTSHAAGRNAVRLWQPSGVVAALTGHLEKHDYIADGRFTAADVYVGSQVGWGLQFGGIPASDTFAAYWDRMKDRPALLAANAKDNALMPKAKT